MGTTLTILAVVVISAHGACIAGHKDEELDKKCAKREICYDCLDLPGCEWMKPSKTITAKKDCPIWSKTGGKKKWKDESNPRKAAYIACKDALRDGKIKSDDFTWIGTSTKGGKTYDGIVKYKFKYGKKDKKYNWKIMFHYTGDRVNHNYDHLVSDDKRLLDQNGNKIHSNRDGGVKIKHYPADLQAKVNEQQAHTGEYNGYYEYEYDSDDVLSNDIFGVYQHGLQTDGIVSDKYYDEYGSYNQNHSEYALIIAIMIMGVIFIGCCCLAMTIAVICGFIYGKFYEISKNQQSQHDPSKYEIVNDNEDQI